MVNLVNNNNKINEHYSEVLTEKQYTTATKTVARMILYEKSKNTGYGYRHQQTFLLFVCLTVAYSMRTCIGVAMVAMVFNGSSENFNITNMSNGIKVDNQAEIGNVGILNGIMFSEPYPKFRWDKKTQDYMMAAFSWGYLILQIPSGQLAHRYGTRYLLTSALVINGVVSFCTPWAAYYGGWAVVVFLRIIQGLSQSCFMPGIHTAFGKWAPLEERGRLSAFAYGVETAGPWGSEGRWLISELGRRLRERGGDPRSGAYLVQQISIAVQRGNAAGVMRTFEPGQPLGIVLGLPITGYIAASNLGWPGIFRFYGLLSLFVGAVLWFLGADSPAQHSKISASERRYIEETLGSSSTHGKKHLKVPWKDLLRCKALYAIVVAHIGQSWGQLSLYTEVPAFMDKVMRVNIKANGVLTALPFFVMWVANFFFSWFADKLIVKKWLSVTNTRKLNNTLGSVMPAIGLILLAYVKKDIVIVETILVITCAFKTAFHVGCYVNHLDLAPNFAGTMMSISNFVANICSSLAPVVAGFILVDDVTSEYLWRKVFLVAAGLYIFTNLVYVVIGSGELQKWNSPVEDSRKNIENDQEQPMLQGQCISSN